MYKMLTTSIAILAAYASFALAQDTTTAAAVETTVTVTAFITVSAAETTYTSETVGTYTSMLQFINGHGHYSLFF